MITRCIRLIGICLALSMVGQSQPLDDNYGKPVVVLYENNPWLMVLGSDTPTFALYETGRAIYKRKSGEAVDIYEAKLTNAEQKGFLQSLEISDAFFKLPEEIEVSSWTDQPTNLLFIKVGDKSKRVSVYGNLRRSLDEGETRPPKEFLHVYEKLIGFKYANEAKWEPQSLEVMLWDYNHAPNKIPWPKSLPDLNSTATKKQGGMYSIFLQKHQFDEFRRYLSNLGERTAVEINGKKLAVSFRFPFPNL